MYGLEETLKELAIPLAEAGNIFLVGIAIRQGQKRKIVQIFADTDSGITIKECAEFSRALESLIEERNLIADAYELEVSSPGLRAAFGLTAAIPETYRTAVESPLYRR